MSNAICSLTLNSVKESNIPSKKEIDVTINSNSSEESRRVVTDLCQRSTVLSLTKKKTSTPTWSAVLTFSVGFLVACWCTSACVSTQEAITDAVGAVVEAAKSVKDMTLAFTSMSR